MKGPGGLGQEVRLHGMPGLPGKSKVTLSGSTILSIYSSICPFRYLHATRYYACSFQGMVPMMTMMFLKLTQSSSGFRSFKWRQAYQFIHFVSEGRRRVSLSCKCAQVVSELDMFDCCFCHCTPAKCLRKQTDIRSDNGAIRRGFCRLCPPRCRLVREGFTM